MICLVFILGCSNHTNDLNMMVKEECEINGFHSEQCKITRSDQLTDIEKISSLGVLYLFGSKENERNYLKSYNFFKISEKYNDAEGLNGLGVIYMFGLGRYKDLNEAEKLLKKANSLGDKNAKNNLGELFRIQKNSEHALYWFNLGIQDNPEKAYEGLSKLYIDQSNFKQAYAYALKAARLRNTESEYNLGVFYERGIHVNKNIDQAIYWYERAANQGHVDAKNNLNLLRKKVNNYP